MIRINEALMLSTETGEQWTDAFLHRLRGEVLLKCDPTNSVPAEVAVLTAIAVAREQKARSFELRAALSLAKLYQLTDRATEAQAVLSSALEGFSPRPEFPEIAEAQAPPRSPSYPPIVATSEFGRRAEASRDAALR